MLNAFWAGSVQKSLLLRRKRSELASVNSSDIVKPTITQPITLPFIITSKDLKNIKRNRKKTNWSGSLEVGLLVRIIHCRVSQALISVTEKVEWEQGMLAPEIYETDIKYLSYTTKRKYNKFFTDKAEVFGYSYILLHLWRCLQGNMTTQS